MNRPPPLVRTFETLSTYVRGGSIARLLTPPTPPEDLVKTFSACRKFFIFEKNAGRCPHSMLYGKKMAQSLSCLKIMFHFKTAVVSETERL